jgi:sugar/nucleoside kinase (ribokinase family)
VERKYDVYGVGNALVDTEVQVDDGFLSSRELTKGQMALVTTQEQYVLLDALSGHKQMGAAGGSAANTMVGLAQFGGRAFYSGKVGSDRRGTLYRESMAEVGVEFDVDAADGPTGTCLVLVTPDGERTMQTSLGSSTTLTAADIHPERIAQSRMLYVEGYLWGDPTPASAAEQAMELARSAKVPVAFSFSDPAMVQGFRNEFRRVTREYVEAVFCNEQEAMAYAGTDDRMTALETVAKDCAMVFMTCGKDGSVIWNHGEVTSVAGYTVPVVDTTGAGDVYAAGVLHGLSQGLSAAQAGTLGSFASARIVTEMGPRLRHRLADHITAILDGAHPLD